VILVGSAAWAKALTAVNPIVIASTKTSAKSFFMDLPPISKFPPWLTSNKTMAAEPKIYFTFINLYEPLFHFTKL
jgi:hypothetical protein